MRELINRQRLVKISARAILILLTLYFSIGWLWVFLLLRFNTDHILSFFGRHAEWQNMRIYSVDAFGHIILIVCYTLIWRKLKMNTILKVMIFLYAYLSFVAIFITTFLLPFFVGFPVRFG